MKRKKTSATPKTVSPLLKSVSPKGAPTELPACAPEFTLALKLHQQSRVDEAEAAYRAILARNPAHADALHLLGVIHLQRAPSTMPSA